MGERLSGCCLKGITEGLNPPFVMSVATEVNSYSTGVGNFDFEYCYYFLGISLCTLYKFGTLKRPTKNLPDKSARLARLT